MKSPAGLTRIEVILILAVLSAFAFLLFPNHHVPDWAIKAQAKNDVTQIATAVTAFETEYGHLPAMPTNGLVDAELVAVLTASNQALNPLKIVFIEINPGKKGKKSGLLDGAFVDPWGSPYHIAISTNTNAPLIAGTNQVALRRLVAVWNAPATHPRPFFGDDPKRNARRYVTSWE